MPLHRKLEQKRAEQAWQCAGEAKKKGADFLERYAGLVKKLPALISTNGLGQTLAFLAAKAKTKEITGQPSRKEIDRDKEEGLLYHHLERWLTWKPVSEEIYKGPYAEKVQNEPDDEPTRLLYRIARSDSTVYRRATMEALAFISWLKPFADALQEKKAGTQEGDAV